MKANKALKRLAKIESLLADVLERYPEAPAKGPLEDAKAAVARAREALNSKPPAAAKKKVASKPKKKAQAAKA